MATYENTEKNALFVGWGYLPEYCIGDRNAKFVTHNHLRGIFIFHD